MFALGGFLSNVAGTALSDSLTDQSIVSTAIPVIVSDFNAYDQPLVLVLLISLGLSLTLLSFDQVAWIITGYFCMCVNILPSGHSLSLTTFSDPMWSYSSRRASAHDPQGEMDAPWCNFLF